MTGMPSAWNRILMPVRQQQYIQRGIQGEYAAKQTIPVSQVEGAKLLPAHM